MGLITHAAAAGLGYAVGHRDGIERPRRRPGRFRRDLDRGRLPRRDAGDRSAAAIDAAFRAGVDAVKYRRADPARRASPGQKGSPVTTADFPPAVPAPVSMLRRPQVLKPLLICS